MQQLGCESHSVTCVSCYVHVYGNKVIIIIQCGYVSGFLSTHLLFLALATMLILMSFLVLFLKNITILASFHVLGKRRSVMHVVSRPKVWLVLSQWFISCFQCFNVNLIFSHFVFIFLSTAYTSHIPLGPL